MVRSISHDYACGVTWVTDGNRAIWNCHTGKHQKGEERVMGWMFDKVGRLIAGSQKPANHREPLTANNSTALRDILRPGDVLLVEGKGRISGSIKYLTQST